MFCGGGQLLCWRDNSSWIVYCWIWFPNVLKVLFPFIYMKHIGQQYYSVFLKIMSIKFSSSLYWPHSMRWAVILLPLNRICARLVLFPPWILWYCSPAKPSGPGVFRGFLEKINKFYNKYTSVSSCDDLLTLYILKNSFILLRCQLCLYKIADGIILLSFWCFCW